MKITLNLNDSLLTNARALAAQQQTTLTRLIEEGLQMRLSAQAEPARPVRLPVYRGKGGLAAGLDSLSNKALLDAAERKVNCVKPTVRRPKGTCGSAGLS